MFSGGSCDGEKMYLEAVNSQRCFLRLCEYGVKFPTDSYGGYPGYKTDHDDTVRATSVGPLTSKAMTQQLEKVVLKKNKTPLLDNKLVIKILTKDNLAYGVRVLDLETEKEENIYAENISESTGRNSSSGYGLFSFGRIMANDYVMQHETKSFTVAPDVVKAALAVIISSI